MPPILRQRGEASESRIDEDRDNQRLRAADAVGNEPEQDTAQRPADEEDRKDDAAVPADELRRGMTAGRPFQEFIQRGMEDERVDRRVHRVEDPSQPGDEENQPL